MATSVIYDLQLIRQMENERWLAEEGVARGVWPSKQFRQMKCKQSTKQRQSLLERNASRKG